ncbi:MAG: amidohydrolase family protein [Nitrososphaerales archaeon]
MPTIDIHTHPFSGSIEGFVREMDRAMVSKAAVLFSIRDPADIDRPEVRERILPRLRGEVRDMDILDDMKHYINSLANPSNKDSAELAKRYLGRFIPFGSVHMHASREIVDSELEEIEELGLHGVKLLPTLQLFNPAESKNFERICEWCEEKNKVIIYHTGCDPGPFEIPEIAEDANPKYLKPVLERYSPKLVLAHFGAYSAYHPGLWFDEAVNIASSFENVFADTSAAVDFLMRADNLARIRNEVGLERLLFGSDYPVVGGSSMKSDADLIRTSPHLSESEKKLILGENAERLLGISAHL